MCKKSCFLVFLLLLLAMSGNVWAQGADWDGVSADSNGIYHWTDPNNWYVPNEEGKYYLKDPAGRQQYSLDLTDVIIKSLAGRTVDEGAIELFVSSMRAIDELKNEHIDKQAQVIIDGIEKGKELDFSIQLDWNELWPESQITQKALESRVNARFEGKDLDKFERAYRAAGKEYWQFKLDYNKLQQEGQ